MKKSVAFLLVVLALFSLFGCNKKTVEQPTAVSSKTDEIITPVDGQSETSSLTESEKNNLASRYADAQPDVMIVLHNYSNLNLTTVSAKYDGGDWKSVALETVPFSNDMNCLFFIPYTVYNKNGTISVKATDEDGYQYHWDNIDTKKYQSINLYYSAEKKECLFGDHREDLVTSANNSSRKK